jgi:hypothetical protein
MSRRRAPTIECTEEKNRTPERESRVFIKRVVVDEMSKREGMMTFLLLSPLCDGRE